MAKNALLKFHNIVNGDMSQSSITSSVTNIQNMDNFGIQLSWVGTSPIGVATVQVSISYQQDAEGNVTSIGTWDSIPLNPTASISGNTGSITIDLNQIPSPWIRVVYTKTSGTGILNSYICGKAV